MIKKVAKFFEKSYSEEEYKKLLKHLQFSNIQNNKMVNLTQADTKCIFKTDDFIREGKSEAWHSFFTPKLKEKANRWIEDNLKNTDLRFPYINIYS